LKIILNGGEICDIVGAYPWYLCLHSPVFESRLSFGYALVSYLSNRLAFFRICHWWIEVGGSNPASNNTVDLNCLPVTIGENG